MPPQFSPGSQTIRGGGILKRKVPRPTTFLNTPGLKSHELLWLLGAVAILVTQQVPLSNLGLDGPEALLRRSIFFVTTPALIGLALAFRRHFGAWLIAFGILLDVVPIATHGGLMPVSYAIPRDSAGSPDCPPSDGTRLAKFAEAQATEPSRVLFHRVSLVAQDGLFFAGYPTHKASALVR